LFFGVAISYAYHFHKSRFLESLSPQGFGVRTAVYLIGSLALGVVMARIVDRWFPSRTTGPIGTPQGQWTT
jgi:hypothetical protein